MADDPEKLINAKAVERDGITAGLLTDAAIVVGPSAAVYLNHHLNKGDKPKGSPPPQEPPKKG